MEGVWKSSIAHFHNNWILRPLNSKANQIYLEWQHKSLPVPIQKRSKRDLQRKLGVELFTGELSIIKAAIQFASKKNPNDQPLTLTAKQRKGISVSGKKTKQNNIMLLSPVFFCSHIWNKILRVYLQKRRKM